MILKYHFSSFVNVRNHKALRLGVLSFLIIYIMIMSSVGVNNINYSIQVHSDNERLGSKTNPNQIGLLVGTMDSSLKIAYDGFLYFANKGFTQLSDISNFDSLKYLFVIAHGDVDGLFLENGFISWKQLAIKIKNTNIMGVILLVCDGASLKNYLPNIAIGGVFGEMDAEAAAYYSGAVYKSIFNEDYDYLMIKLKNRLVDIDNGAIIYPLGHNAFLSRACSYTEYRNSWNIVYGGKAWCAFYGAASVPLILSTFYSVLFAVTAGLGSSSAAAAKLLVAVANAAIVDVTAVLIQVAIGVFKRSDHKAVMGLQAGMLLYSQFWPYVDYGNSGRFLLVLPYLYTYIATAGIAGLIGVVLTEGLIGPIAYLAFKNWNTNGGLRTVVA